MFHDLDATLQAILDDDDAPVVVKDAEVSFATPDKDFAPNGPTLDLFLLEVAENRALRNIAPVRTRVGDTFVDQRPPLRVDGTYLVTAWSAQPGDVRPAEEHELLGRALLWLARFPVIEDRFHRGEMTTQPFPLDMTVAQTPEGQNLGQFWSALGVPPRPAFTLTVTVALQTVPEDVTWPKATGVTLEPAFLTAPALAGRVLDGALAAVAQATVTVTPGDMQITTGADGRFRVPELEFGEYDLLVEAAGRPDVQATVQFRRTSQVHTVIVPSP